MNVASDTYTVFANFANALTNAIVNNEGRWLGSTGDLASEALEEVYNSDRLGTAVWRALHTIEPP